MHLPAILRSALLLAGLFLACLISAAPPPVLVTVQPDRRHQVIDGFGCSISGWFAPSQAWFRDPAFARYAALELGQSVFRLQMWGGTLPDEIADWRDITFDKFDWDGGGTPRGRLNRDWARMMVDANPEVKIIGAVWSPPGWMKVSGQRRGTKAGFISDAARTHDRDNRLRPDRFEHFAKWVVEFARAMEAQGTPFHAISLQNEPLFTQPYESVLYTPEEYARLVRVTGEMFEREGVRKPLFYGPEDMTLATADSDRHRPYVEALMAPGVERHFDAFATHGYSDGIQGDSRFNVIGYWHAIKARGRPYWITEGASGSHEWPGPVTGGIASQLHVALTQANVSLFTGWQLTASEDAPELWFMVDAKPTKKTHATMQFWRHVRPGSVRVEVANDTPADLLVSAFVHDARGEAVSVLINTGAEPRDVLLNWGRGAPTGWRAWQTSATQDHAPVEVAGVRGMVRLTLPAQSVSTVVADWDRARADPRVDARWERDIQAIERREAEAPVPANGILFAGSSSILLWKTLAADFPGQPVYQRGFGGSRVSDLLGYFDRVIKAGHPRQVVIYSGTNDLSSGRSAEHVLGDIDELCRRMKEALPGARIAFIGAAANPRRWSARAEHLRFNAMLRHYCQREGHDFIDVWGPMLGDDGLPSRDYYQDDQLHMNAAGYALWRDIVGPYLQPVAARSSGR